MDYTKISTRDNFANGLVVARKYAVSIISAAIGFSVFLPQMKRIYTLASPSFSDYSYLALLLVTISLVFIWIWATQKELDILLTWVDTESYHPPDTIKETAIIFGEAILLVLLIYTAQYPFFYGLTFLTYSLVVMLAVAYLNRELQKAFDDTRKELQLSSNQSNGAMACVHLKAIDVLEDYFIKRPHTPRHMIILGFSALSALCASLGSAYTNEKITAASYILILLTICISEFVIGKWRISRDVRLGKILSELRHLLNAPKN
jgi:hypothetical protein